MFIPFIVASYGAIPDQLFHQVMHFSPSKSPFKSLSGDFPPKQHRQTSGRQRARFNFYAALLHLAYNSHIPSISYTTVVLAVSLLSRHPPRQPPGLFYLFIPSIKLNATEREGPFRIFFFVFFLLLVCTRLISPFPSNLEKCTRSLALSFSHPMRPNQVKSEAMNDSTKANDESASTA